MSHVRSPLKKDSETSEPISITTEMLGEIYHAITKSGMLPKGPTQLLVDNAMDHIMRNLELQSYGKKITPERWPVVVNKVIDRWVRSQIKQGRPVAILGSEAWIANVMQMTLNTFHLAGTASNTGFKATYELMHVPVDRSINEIYLHFNQPMTTSQVFEMRSLIVYRKIKDLLVDEEIYSYEIEPFSNLHPIEGPHWWQKAHMAANGVIVPENALVLRLKFSVSSLLTYKVSLKDIADLLIGLKPKMIYIMYSPMRFGYVDIYYNKKEDNKIPEDDLTSDMHYRIFYKNYIIPDLSIVKASGIKGVRNLRVATTTVESVFYRIMDLSEVPKKAASPMGETDIIFSPNDEAKILKDDGYGTVYYVEFRRDVLRYEGISHQEITRFVEAHGGKINYDPNDMDFAVMGFNDGRSAKNAFRGSINDPDGTISEHAYAILDSIELTQIMKLPFTDLDRTYCNNYHIMAYVFGIGVARSYHYYNSMQMIEAIDTTTNVHHISTFSDIVTQRGIFKGIGSGGIAKEDTGFISRSVISEPHKILPAAAMFDSIGEGMSGTAAAIFLGQWPDLGTGSCDYGVIKKIEDFEDFDFTGEDLDRAVIELGGEEKESEIIEQVFDSAQSQDDIEDVSMFNPGYISVKAKTLRADRKSVTPMSDVSTLTEKSYATLNMVRQLTPPIYGSGIPSSTLNMLYRYMNSPVDIILSSVDPSKPVVPIPKLNITQREVLPIDIQSFILYMMPNER
jgi:hypothetical protein